MLELKRAELKDIDIAMGFINEAKAHLKEQGIDQWQDGYPNMESLRGDMEEGVGYFLCEGEEKVGYICIGVNCEPAYDELEGSWHKEGDYAVMHRLAISSRYRGKGLADQVFRLAEEFCRENGIGLIRVDTDEGNKKMMHIFEKNGFVRCGVVRFDNSPKTAFDKIL